MDSKTLRDKLRRLSVLNPDLEARVLLDEYGSDGDRLIQAIARREKGEPLSRIVGHQEFWGLNFTISFNTLDPRQDTETLIQTALDRFTEVPPQRILDIGTGSGCILISLLHEWPETHGVGTDISNGAIAVAQQNAKRHGVHDRAEFIQTNWAEKIDGTFDLILSNPPYISTAVIPNLATNVKDYDPILALDGGPDGLDAYRSILREIKIHLAPGGLVLFEIGYDQSEDVLRLVAEYGATHSRLVPDLSGIPRVLECRWG